MKIPTEEFPPGM